MYNLNVDVDKIKANLRDKGVTNPQENESQAKTILNSIIDFAKKTEIEKEEKEARYVEACKLRNQYKEQVSALKSQLASNPSKQKQYAQAVSLFENAEIETDIARMSFNDANWFANKMNTQAIIAQNIIC